MGVESERLEIQPYISLTGQSPFTDWFGRLNPHAAARVSDALHRMEQGNLSSSSVKRLTGGIFEYRINYGPGYRIYFGRRGQRIIILLGGGTKQRQQSDIHKAQRLWKEHLQSIRRGE